MYDIITFGSATQDIFLKSKSFLVKEEKKVFNQKELYVSLGSKIPVEEIDFLYGGGGANVAFTFKNQGFKVAYCGAVGKDLAGDEIKKRLTKKGISTDFLFFDKEKHTNYSVILATEDERTILVYRGASETLANKNIPWGKLKAKWFYIAPLSGKLAGIWEKILKFAKKNKIKIAMNPGNTQLSLPKNRLKKLLNFADVLILNQEEASLATDLSYNKEKEIFKRLDEWVEGICIMTKGPFGGVVSDGKYLYNYGVLKTKKIVDRTGCGDAFGSGFVTGLIKWSPKIEKKTYLNQIEYAIQFGSLNAVSCLQIRGAQNGLLKKGEDIFKFGKVKIKKEKL
ncbi:MAG TPA: carbohydrate kinase family protein [Candidatus Pacearchaeota archaeon]|nr:carbohydrate kinase family protein [Candidatus Pacearchaeota archaeon]HOK94185.1 carbohydrate kinase family protein [Candidatus Pacearchaeota archaeon]HPO75175.1 carbohydrate kinase family protein [Candidatus Pacearchaeota archaeon]